MFAGYLIAELKHLLAAKPTGYLNKVVSSTFGGDGDEPSHSPRSVKESPGMVKYGEVRLSTVKYVLDKLFLWAVPYILSCAALLRIVYFNVTKAGVLDPLLRLMLL